MAKTMREKAGVVGLLPVIQRPFCIGIGASFCISDCIKSSSACSMYYNFDCQSHLSKVEKKGKNSPRLLYTCIAKNKILVLMNHSCIHSLIDSPCAGHWGYQVNYHLTYCDAQSSGKDTYLKRLLCNM